MEQISYSVIIPTYNGSNRIAVTIESLVRQTISPQEFEIIVVDDCSSDNTEATVKKCQADFPNYSIEYIRQERNTGPAAARNRGILKAAGHTIFFADDDCELPATWMENHIKIYAARPEIAGVCGWYVPSRAILLREPCQSFFLLLYRYFTRGSLETYEGDNERARKRGVIFPFLNTGNFSGRKWMMLHIGGFNERFIAPGSEDAEFGDRIRDSRFLLYYLPQLIMHRKHMNLIGLIRVAKNRAMGRAVYRAVKLEQNRNLQYLGFSREWREFRNFYKMRLLGSNPYHIPRSMVLISGVFFFIIESQISLWLFERKVKKRHRRNFRLIGLTEAALEKRA